MKKFLSLLLAILMVLTASPFTLPFLTFAEEATTPTYEVPDDYVTEGLVSFYDGAVYAENTWLDMAGENDITTIEGASFVYGAYFLDKKQQELPTALLDVIKGTEFTVEIALGSVASTSTYATLLCNTGTEYLSLYAQKSKNSVFFKTSGIGNTSRPSFSFGEESYLAPLQDATLSFTYKNGDVAAIYLNGELMSEKTAPASNGNNSTSATGLLLNQAASGKYTTAEYKGLRFYSKALTAEEVAQNYSADALEYVEEGLVSLYDGNGYTDSAWLDRVGNNDVTVGPDNGTFIDGAYLLDGTVGEQQPLPTALLNVIKGEEFTIEISLGAIASTTKYATLLCNNNGMNSEKLALYANKTDKKMYFKTSGISSRPSFLLTSGSYTLDSLKDGTLSFTYKNGDVAAIYLNGVLMASSAAPTTNGNNTSSVSNFTLNPYTSGSKETTAEYKGLRFYSKALTAEEVAQNYQKDQRYIGLKTPEEEPLEIDTTVLDNTASYVQDGLVARFDAEYNVEGGHANNAKTWVDTVNGYTVKVAGTETNYFSATSYRLSDAQYTLPTELLDLVNGEAYTVELALGEILTADNDFATFITSMGNDNFALFLRTAGDFVEFKSKTNDRPKVMDGKSIFSNSTVAITFDLAAGVCILYVDGVEISRAEVTVTAGAKAPFVIGCSTATKMHTTEYKELRFYNRALTAEEVAANAQADETYNPDYVALTGFAETLQPETGIAGDVVLSEYITSLEQLQALLTSENIPANMIFYIDSALEITDETGASSGAAVADLFTVLDNKVIPTFYVKDSETVTTLTAYLSEKRISDVFVMSDNEALVKSARTACPQIRGIINYSAKYTEALTDADLTAIRKAVNGNMSKVVILPYGVVTNAQIKKLNQGGLSVWLDAQAVTSEAEAVKALLSGTYGIVGSADLMLTAAKAYIPAGTVTRPPVMVAHRGYHTDYPENTIEAFDAAYKAGADMVEVDIYLTTDGELAICHNSTTGAIFGSTNNLTVENCTMAELNALYATAADGTECHLPSLRQVFEYFKDTDLGFMIEIKSSNTEIVAVLKALVEEYGMYDRCAIITFARTGMFDKLLEVYPEMPASYLADAAATASTASEQAQMVQMMINQYNLSYAPNYSGVTEEFIRANIQRGISTWLWTVNSAANISKFTTLGATGITSDQAGLQAELPFDFPVDVSYEEKIFTINTAETATVTLLAGNATVEGNAVTATAPGAIELLVTDTVTINGYTYQLASIVELNYTTTYDLNGDGIMNISDVSLLLDYLSNPDSVVIAFGASADINGNNECDISDVSALLDILAAQ